VLEPHKADIQDRDGAGPLLKASRASFPFIEKVFADGGYAGERVARATSIAVEIVRKSPSQIGFAVQPRRWVVERFFAWSNRNRRLAKCLPSRRRGTSKPPSTPPEPSSTPPPSCSSSGEWLGQLEFRVRL